MLQGTSSVIKIVLFARQYKLIVDRMTYTCTDKKGGKLLFLALALVVITVCVVADLFDTVQEKDEQARQIFLEPRGCKDTDMYNAMRAVGDAYDLVTKYLRIRNASVIDVAQRLYNRSTPLILSEVFSTDNLRVTFKWVDSDVRYFNYLYQDLENKWNSFRREYRNASLYMWKVKTKHLY